jgi:hypothetical protein
MDAATAESERRALWVLRITGSVVLVLGIALAILMPSRPVSENVPGFQNAVIGFELASEPAHVFGILGRPGEPARAEAVRRMDLGNRLDFLYMLAYPELYVGIGLLLAAHGRIGASLTKVLILLALCMTVGDALENRQLFALSAATDEASMAGPLRQLRFFTLVKWYALYGASGLAAAFIWRENGWWRWSALFFGAAALCGVLSLVHLPAIEYGTAALLVAWLMTFVRSFQRG